MSPGDFVVYKEGGSSKGLIMEISDDRKSAMIWWLRCSRYNFESVSLQEVKIYNG